jgi:RHS repeat-associated protein
VRHRDQAGVVTVDRYDPFGKVLRAERRLRSSLDSEPDWADPDSVDLDAAHVSEASWDALGRVLRALPPDGSVRTTEYLRGGGVARLRWAPADGTGDELVLLDRIQMNARGQRTNVLLGNAVTVAQRYDPDSFRVAAITATRPAGGGRPARVLQQLAFTYDPVGNVTRVVDGAQEPTAPTPLLQGATVTTARDHTFDAAYQLKTATGRVHQALLEHDHRPGAEAGGAFRGTRRLSLNDGQAVERYTQEFTYDLAGNLTSIQHHGQTRSWTTELWVSPTSNRSLPRRDLNGVVIDPTEQEQRFDPAGNCTRLPHLRELVWSYRSQIARAVVVQRDGGPDDAESYLHDADGLRVRKVAQRLVAGQVETTEKLYLDGCEIKRVRRGDTLLLERVTSVVSDGERRVALVHRWTVDSGQAETPAPGRQVHYPLHDQVGSAALELDDDGEVAAYEEFLPYGGSAFLAGETQRAARKDDRFAGKERDDATGLYDFGYRAYAPWIGRWLSPDPAGAQDSLNLYLYAQNNPVSLVDPDGLQTRTREPAPTGEVFLGFVSQIPPLFRPEWNKLTRQDQVAVFEGRKTLYYDLKTERFQLLTQRELRARERQMRVGIIGLGKPPPPAPPGAGGGRGRGPARQPAAATRRSAPGTGAKAAVARPEPPPPPKPPGGDGTDPGDPGDAPATPAPPAEAGEGTDTDPGGTGTGLVGEGEGARLRGEGEGGGGTGETAGFADDPGGTGLGAAGEGAGVTGEDPGGGLAGERDQPGLPPPPEGRPADTDTEQLATVPGGVEGGGRGGVPGGTVGGAEIGAVDPNAPVVPGLEEADPNGSADGARFGTRTGTGSAQGGQQRPDAGRGSGGPEPVLDRLVRYAGYTQLEFQERTGTGPPRGIPGGFGKGEPGTATKVLYLACVIGGLLLGGAGLIKSLAKKVLGAGLRKAATAVAALFTRRFWRKAAERIAAWWAARPIGTFLARRVTWAFGKLPKGTMGTTHPLTGVITISNRLAGKRVFETVLHEGVHRFLIPRGGRFSLLRARIGDWFFQHSHLVKWLEEGIAESLGTGSLRRGLAFPFQANYGLSVRRVVVEALAYLGLVGAAAYGVDRATRPEPARP